MDAEQTARTDSMALNNELNQNAQALTSNELHKFMMKYQQLDIYRSKYMICIHADHQS